MSEAFNPTPEQVGHILVGAVQRFPLDQMADATNSSWLKAADISIDDYLDELFLLCICAAIWTVKSLPIHRDVQQAVLTGIQHELIEANTARTAYAASALDAACDEYAEAVVQQENEPPPSSDQPSEIEYAFGERLMARGEDNESRGHACIRLALVTPKTLWAVQTRGAMSSLTMAGLADATQ